ncbi:MAG: BlaI/MecI/CopY family transcriptional regulator [Chlamydiales bacterium]|nr:BlaI/MecI/CopY family transcriptional regulator [Chlamydiales bacterium]
MRKLSFGELELSILQALRQLNRATVRDVYTSLGGQGSYTTIMTVMSRMADKGELMRKKEGKKYCYWIDSTNQVPSKNILKRIQDKIFGGKPTALVSYLLRTDKNISHQELTDIETLIQELKKPQKEKIQTS